MLDPQIIGNAGLYYCCYRLSLLGWNVMPTARNARGVDIVAYTKDAKRFLGIQVKALSKRNPVPLGTSLDRIMGDFWIIVNKIASDPSAFILLPDEVKERARRGEKDGRVSYCVTAGSKPGQNHRFGTMPPGLMSARRHSAGAKNEAASAEAAEIQAGWISGGVGFA